MNTNFGELKALIQVKYSQLYLRKVLMADRAIPYRIKVKS